MIMHIVTWILKKIESILQSKQADWLHPSVCPFFLMSLFFILSRVGCEEPIKRTGIQFAPAYESVKHQPCFTFLPPSRLTNSSSNDVNKDNF